MAANLAAIGSHGETVRGLLQPGFHSGTVPRLYARLRAAERRAVQTRVSSLLTDADVADLHRILAAIAPE